MTVLPLLQKISMDQKIMVEMYTQPLLGVPMGRFMVFNNKTDPRLRDIYDVEVFEIFVDISSGLLCIRV